MRMRRILPGTGSLTADEAVGSVVLDPSYAATSNREGPGGTRAFQLPSGPVVTTASCVNECWELLGAVSRRIGCPAIAVPLGNPSQPLTVVPWPNGTRRAAFRTTRGRRTT